MIQKSETPVVKALEEAARIGWMAGRNSWCPAGVLADEPRTERDWRDALIINIAPKLSAIEAPQPAPIDDAELLEAVEKEAKALLAQPAPSVREDWRDDPSADERWCAGLDYGQTQLCHVLGIDPQTVNWDAATETLDGDVQSVIGNILTMRFGENWCSPPPHGAVEALRELYDAAMEASVENRAARILSAAIHKARAALAQPAAQDRRFVYIQKG